MHLNYQFDIRHTVTVDLEYAFDSEIIASSAALVAAMAQKRGYHVKRLQGNVEGAGFEP